MWTYRTWNSADVASANGNGNETPMNLHAMYAADSNSFKHLSAEERRCERITICALIVVILDMAFRYQILELSEAKISSNERDFPIFVSTLLILLFN